MTCFVTPRRGNDKILYDKLLSHFKLSEAVLNAKIGVWQQQHGNTEEIPTIAQLEIYQDDNVGIFYNKEADLSSRVTTYLNDVINTLRDQGLVRRWTYPGDSIQRIWITHGLFQTEIQKQGLKSEREAIIKNRIEEVLESLEYYGIPRDAVIDTITENSAYINFNVKKVKDYIESLNDKIGRNISSIENLFDNSKESRQVLSVLNFLSKRFGIEYKVVDEAEAKTLLKKSKNSTIKPNAFVVGNTAYFIKGRKLNTDIAAEEILHPFIASIKVNNPKAFSSLLADAKRAYPKLESEINVAYTEEENRNEELVAQALSRAFNEDRKDYPNGHPIKELIRNFIDSIRKFFNPYAWNNTFPDLVDSTMISENITIADLASVVNSDIQFYSDVLNGVRLNQETSSEYNTEGNMTNDATSELGQEMYKTWSNPKTITMRAFRISKMFSDEVTRLEKELSDEERSSSSFENRKYIITKKTGVKRILDSVRERIASTYANKEWVTDYINEINEATEEWTPEEAQSKINYIFDQGNLMLKFFEPLCLEANNEIKQNESISIFNKEGNILSVEEEEDEFDETGIAKHNEGYFSKVHEESTEETLAREIRLLMGNIYEIDEDGGYTQFDDLEEPIPYDFKYIHATTLSIVSKVVGDKDMIPALQKSVEKYPWMKQVLDALLGRDTFTNTIYEGMSPEDRKAKTLDLQAKFWNGYHKILVNIAVQEVDEDGEVTSRVVNNPEGEEAAFKNFENTCNTCKTLFNGRIPYKAVYKKDGTFNEEVYMSIYNALISSKLYQKLEKGQLGQFTNDEVNLVDRALKAFGVDVPIENLVKLLNPNTSELNDSEIEDIRSKVLKLHEVLYKGFYTNNRNNNTPLSSVLSKETPKNIFDAFNSNYHILAQIFGDETMGFEESSASYKLSGEYKKLFSHILPNPIHTIFNKLFNIDKLSEADYRRRVEEDYLGNWWFQPTKGIIRSGWLRDFYNSPKLRAGIRLKTLKASKGVEYSKEIDSQAEITRLNEFFNSKNRREFGGKMFTDYSVPAFSDTSESYYCSGRYYNTAVTSEYNELRAQLIDVLRQELERIKVVRRRAEINRQFLEAGKKKPIQPIAVWDISYKEVNGEWVEDTSKPSGNQFHFFPMLNESKDAFIKKLSTLDDNPQAQEELLGRAVDYALNQEFEFYLSNFNTWGINKLEKSKYKEKERTNLVEYVKSQMRPDTPENIKTEVSSILDRLYNETLTQNTYDNLKSRLIDLLTNYTTFYQGETPETAHQRFSHELLNNPIFKLDTTNLGKLRDYFLNSYYANTQIIELTMRDPAFLGSPDKFQKRFKQFYSPVATCYTSHYMYDEAGNIVEVTDLTGTQVNEDGKRVNNETSLTLSDNIMTEALSIDNTIAAIQKQVTVGKLSQTQADEIIKNMKEINSADAQCYRTLPSWQKCLNCIGQASNTKAQKAIERLIDGTWNYSDYYTVWQVFKPFVSSYMSVDTHLNETLPNGLTMVEMNSQYDKISAPTQHKNSEFLMLAIYSKLSGVISESPKFRALNKFMVDHNIDKVQFQSAVKVSNQGCIDLNECTTYDDVIRTLEVCTGLTGTMKAEEGDQDVIHTIPFSDWGISTSMPEHLLSHERSSLGTQIMKIIMEDIHPDMKITIGNTTKTREQWLELYQALFTQDLMESFHKVDETLTNTEKLAAYLKEQIYSQNKYSQELIKHLELDESGNFKNPIIDPMLRADFDALCASLLRNDVTKRPFRMGALPQVASWGFEDKLQLRYQDSQGRLILTKDEFKEKGYIEHDNEVRQQDGSITTKHVIYNTWDEYKKYADENSSKIAYLEVFMPPFDNNFLSGVKDIFIDKETGKFDFEAFNKVADPELLEAIGYRVPSEAKHSMIPLKIKGFLPSQNSSCVMIAPEWIAISDSDNDGDKLYTLFYESEVVYNESRIIADWISNGGSASEAVQNTKKFREFADEKKKDLSYILSIKPIEYKLKDLERLEGESDSDYQHRREMASIASNSLAARNNLRLDLMKGILQTEENTAQMLIPGGFPEAKRVTKYMKSLMKIGSEMASICNPAIRTMHQVRNMAGANLISIYANYRSLRPLMQLANLSIHPNYRITINDNQSLPKDNAGNITWSLSELRNSRGQYITDNISNFLGCAVDNTKEPLLSFLGQNEVTAPISMALINMGYTIKEVALFMNQPIVKDLVRQYYLSEGSTTLKRLVKGSLNDMEQSLEYTQSTLSPSMIKSLSEEIMASQIERQAQGLPQDFNDLAIQHQVLISLDKIIMLSDALNNINSITRADTQNGSAKSRSSINKQKVLMIDRMKEDVSREDYPIVNAEKLIPTVDRTTYEEDIANAKLPQVAAFRFYGLDQIPRLFRNISLTFNPVVDKVHQRALEISGKLQLSPDTIDSLTNATASYFLTQIKAFNSGKLKGAPLRLSTIYYAVNIINEIKQKNLIPENVLIQDLVANKLGNEYSKYIPVIILPKRSRKNQGALNNYRRAWESLIANGDKTITVHTPDGSREFEITYKDVSNLLLKYCFLTNGMNTGGNSFINCFPPSRVSEIEGYIQELKSMLMRTESTQIDNIVDQFVANHPEDNNFTHKIKLDDFTYLTKDSAVIPTRIECITNSSSTDRTAVNILTSDSDGTIAYPYIYINLKGSRLLYKGSTIDGKVIYTRCNVLGNTENGYLEEYDYGRGIDFLDEESAISIIPSNRVPSFNASQEGFQKYIENLQSTQEEAEGITPQDFVEVLKNLAGDGIQVDISMAKYNSQTTDLTGVEFCAIL